MISGRHLLWGVRNKTRKLFFCFCLFMLFASVVPCYGAELYSADLKEGIDVILLIDVSGSMQASDKSKNALEATKMFIDMLEKKSSRIGIMAFTDNVVGVCELQEINSHADRERLKKEVDSFEYDGYTDIGLSLKSAVEVMTDGMKDANSPMILMLTDGNVEIDEQSNGRTKQQSYEDIVSAIVMLGDKLPIYTIGLNYNNNVDEQVLTTISNQTNARSYVIKEADMLPQIFNEIFADHIKSSLQEVASFVSDGESYTDIKIDITSNFVIEANVIMLSTSELINAELYGPDGSVQSFDQDVVTFSQSNKYAIIKIVNPGMGQWLLKAKGIKDDTIKVNLIYKYDVGLDISVQQQDGSGGFFVTEPIEVTGRFISNGLHAEDAVLYEQSVGTLYVTDSGGEVVYTEQMTVNGSVFTAKYIPDTVGFYKVYIKTTSADFSTDSAVIEVEVSDKPKIEYPEDVEEPATEEEPPADVEESNDAEPSQIKKNSNNTAMIIVSGILLLGVLVLIGCYVYVKTQGNHCFIGYIEVRAMGVDGVYTSLETPSLNSYAKKTSLKTFFTESLKIATQSKIVGLPFDIDGIILTQKESKDSYVIQLDNKSNCRIVSDEGHEMDTPIMWHDRQRLTIKGYGENDVSKIEITYRAEEI